jgi:hypothetical protein
MTTSHYSTAFVVPQNPEQVFNAINNVRGWWSENIKGDTEKLGDEFAYRYRDVHHCTIKVTESILGKKGAYITGSLRDLIATGRGRPSPKEGLEAVAT